MDDVTSSTRARIAALTARIAELLDHEPSPDLAAVLESARDDLGRIERALDGMEPAASAVCVPESKVWRVAKALELYGPNAQWLPEDLRHFELAGQARLGAPDGWV
mgnify:CR=1 FL=1